MTTNVFIKKQKTEFGELTLMCTVEQLLLNGLYNLKFDAEKNGKKLLTTLNFDMANCRCMKETIDWLQEDGKIYLNRFVSLVKKVL